SGDGDVRGAPCPVRSLLRPTHNKTGNEEGKQQKLENREKSREREREREGDLNAAADMMFGAAVKDKVAPMQLVQEGRLPIRRDAAVPDEHAAQELQRWHRGRGLAQRNSEGET